jgi:hypothetical protein
MSLLDHHMWRQVEALEINNDPHTISEYDNVAANLWQPCINLTAKLQQSRSKVATKSWQTCSKIVETLQQTRGKLASNSKQGCGQVTTTL